MDQDDKNKQPMTPEAEHENAQSSPAQDPSGGEAPDTKGEGNSSQMPMEEKTVESSQNPTVSAEQKTPEENATSTQDETKPMEGEKMETTSQENTGSVTPNPVPSEQANGSQPVNPPQEGTEPSAASTGAPMTDQPKSGKKGLFIALITVIILILLGVAGYMVLMMKPSLNNQPVATQATVTPPIATPSPTQASASANAPLDQQAEGVDVGSADQDIQNLQTDVNQL